jgi:hypothetical protein
MQNAIRMVFGVWSPWASGSQSRRPGPGFLSTRKTKEYEDGKKLGISFPGALAILALHIALAWFWYALILNPDPNPEQIEIM